MRNRRNVARILPVTLILPGLLLAGFVMAGGHGQGAAVFRTQGPVANSPTAATSTIPPVPSAILSPTMPRHALGTPALTGRPTQERHASLSAPSRTTPHVRTGGISYVLSHLADVQGEADRRVKRYRYAVDPVMVTIHDLPAFGFVGAPIRVVTPPPPHLSATAHAGEDGLPETDVIVRYRGKQYWVVLNQFERQGPRGIWSVITITRM